MAETSEPKKWINLRPSANVNFASRLTTDKANNGEITISSATRNKIGDRFKIKDRGISDDLQNIYGEFPLFEVTG